MKLKLTKKGKIILFVILGIVVLGSGGFLLWRVLQPETVAPEDSEAGGGCGPCCNPSFGCVSGWKCVQKACVTSVTCSSNEDCGSAAGNGTCNTSCIDGKCTGSYKCVKDEGPPTEGDCKDVKCEWPTVVMSQLKCACKRCNEVSGVCSGDPPKCTPPPCPSGYVSCGTSGNHESISECKKNTSKLCWGNHPDCNNPFVVYRYCKPAQQEPENICEGGKWVNKPSGTYEYCSKDFVNPKISATDKDGISNILVNVPAISNNIPTCTGISGQQCYNVNKTNEDKTANITFDMLAGRQCLSPGDYNITFTWKDGKGVGGNNCTLSTSFTISEQEISESCGDGILKEAEQCELGDPTGVSCTWDECNQTTCTCPEVVQNPNWDISKSGVKECIVDEEITYAKATYTITVTNIGEGEGSIDKVEDTLDEKVLENYLSDISNGGAYTSGVITWDLEGDEEIFQPEDSKVFTYHIKVPEEAYGIFENTVTAHPAEGENFSDSENLNLVCDIEEEEEDEPPVVPETGIFDTVIGKVLLGVILILLGINWPNITGALMKFNYSIKEGASDRRMNRFERKVAKRK